MTYRVRRLFLDSQEVKCFGIFQTEGEAKMRLAQVLEEALQPICENYAQRWSGQGYDQCQESLVEEIDLLAIRDAR